MKIKAMLSVVDMTDIPSVYAHTGASFVSGGGGGGRGGAAGARRNRDGSRNLRNQPGRREALARRRASQARLRARRNR